MSSDRAIPAAVCLRIAILLVDTSAHTSAHEAMPDVVLSGTCKAFAKLSLSCEDGRSHQLQKNRGCRDRQFNITAEPMSALRHVSFDGHAASESESRRNCYRSLANTP